MYRTFALTLTLSALGFIAPAALAADNDGAYVNIALTQLSTDLDLSQLDIGSETIDLGKPSLDIKMITGRLGYRLGDYFAVEGEFGKGFGGDTINKAVPITVGTTTVNIDTKTELDIDSYYGAFARGIFPVSEQFDIFARAGYGVASAKGNATASLAGITVSGSETEKASGLAYGVGGEYRFTDTDGVRLDYSRLEDTNIISVAYSRRF